MARNCKCPHLENVLQLSLSELCKSKQGKPCSKCDTYGPNLWICLYKNCLQIGCSETYNDHSTKHFDINENHCIHMNLSSTRMWCYVCETEVFLMQTRRSSLISNDSSDASRYSTRVAVFDRIGGADSCDSSGDEDDSERQNQMSGLIGLQNIANTCYMNAALQALSNTPPLTGYLLNCGDIIEATADLTCQRKAGLARSYHRLVKDMWGRNQRSNGYLVPSGILNGIRNVHPMFRGYQQHDTQEFLRCFMDQLHEELKEVTPPPPDGSIKNETENDDDQSECSTSSSPSEVEYETCDSNISEESSLSEDIPINLSSYTQLQQQLQQQRRYSRSPSPTNSLTINQSKKLNQTTLSNNTFSNAAMANQNSVNIKNQTSTTTKQPHRSIISDVFDGKLLSSVQCLTCNRISTRTETFQDLSLPIPSKDHLTVLHQSQNLVTQQPTGVTCTDAVYQATQVGWFAWLTNWLRSLLWGPAVSLHDCMAAFFSADELKGDNMYSCEKCNKLRNGMKFSRVLELPEMLCVHLKRFRHDLSYSSKITSPVNFPLRGLDMSIYLHKDCKSVVSTYDLTAIICHHGTVGGGHYTCFAKHQLSGKWYEYDDQLVTEVAEEVVQNCEAYVLFYRKSNLWINQIREQAQQAELGAEQAAVDINFYISKQWLNRFNTFAEPGPIDNWALLCPHGALPPSKAKIKEQLLVALPQPLWDFLYQKFGGGPAFNHLYECDICLRAAELLTRRQNYELEAFQAYKDEMSSTIYAISMSWFRQWQLFIGRITNELPGPINNAIILCQNESGIRTVKPGSDYAQITASLWRFFYGIYGGGPEIILRGGPTVDEIRETKYKNETAAADPLAVSGGNQIGTENVAASSKPSLLRHGSELGDKQDANDVIQENGISQVSPPAVVQKKIVKNVSFENDENHQEKEMSTANQQDASVASNLKRSKQSNIKSNSNVGTSEIVSKRDKRHHGEINTNGLFGPDGTYSEYSQYNNIPTDEPSTNSYQQQPQRHQSSSHAKRGQQQTTDTTTMYNNYSSPNEYNEGFQQIIPNNISQSDVNSTIVSSTTNNNNNTTTAATSTLQTKDPHHSRRKFKYTNHAYQKKLKFKSRQVSSVAATSSMNSSNELNLSDSDNN